MLAGVGAEQGIALAPIVPRVEVDGTTETLSYGLVTVTIQHHKRIAQLTIQAPGAAPASTAAALHAQGDQSWALAAFRQLDTALLELRFNHPQDGLLLLRTSGDMAQVLAHDTALTSLRNSGDWLAREIQLHQARVLRRLDNMSRSMFALAESKSAFVGVLAEILWAADRAYMLDDADGDNAVALHPVNDGAFLTHNGMTRLAIRNLADPSGVAKAFAAGSRIGAADAERLGLVTRAPDDIDWEDEIRLAIEERVSFSPDALTGMEQNLRFAGPENADTKLFGRLTAWQNWIFQRPNAVGDRGALVMYGDPQPPIFDFTRT